MIILSRTGTNWCRCLSFNVKNPQFIRDNHTHSYYLKNSYYVRSDQRKPFLKFDGHSLLHIVTYDVFCSIIYLSIWICRHASFLYLLSFIHLDILVNSYITLEFGLIIPEIYFLQFIFSSHIPRVKINILRLHLLISSLG